MQVMAGLGVLISNSFLPLREMTYAFPCPFLASAAIRVLGGLQGFFLEFLHSFRKMLEDLHTKNMV